MNKFVIIAVTVVITVIITAFTLLSIMHVDTDKFVQFLQLGFAGITSVVGVFLVKRTGEAVVTAQAATDQVAQVSNQVADVQQMVNGNTAALIARVGPVLPENDTVITTLTPNTELHETGEH